MNKLNEIKILMVRAFTVLLVFPESRSRKMRPLAKEPAIIIMVKMMMTLVIICYTPETKAVAHSEMTEQF